MLIKACSFQGETDLMRDFEKIYLELYLKYKMLGFCTRSHGLCMDSNTGILSDDFFGLFDFPTFLI